MSGQFQFPLQASSLRLPEWCAFLAFPRVARPTDEEISDRLFLVAACLWATLGQGFISFCLFSVLPLSLSPIFV